MVTNKKRTYLQDCEKKNDCRKRSASNNISLAAVGL
jgi:hypothetical protein